MDKQKKLDQLREKYSKVTDGLKKPIDQDILETVVLLNALNINTIGSCEGHLDWGIAAPWVAASAPETEENKQLWQKYRELENLVKDKKAQDAHVSEVQAIADELTKLGATLREKALESLPKLLDLLDEFYQNRQIQNDARLIVIEIGWMNRLISQGAVIQEILPADQKKANLARYQEEMRAFTEFLEKKFLGS